MTKRTADVRKRVEGVATPPAVVGPAAVDPRIPTARQRYLAAKIRIRADEALKESTPEWVVRTAAEGKDRFGR